MGEVLRIQRQKIGYTSLETFANDIGMDSALYGRYERGENMKVISLARLLSHYNLEIDNYFNQVGKIINKNKNGRKK
ncbi:MAG: helix-turn-helix domain-containing protein [Bacteroidetes bacterium]|nr:helix-turn-helix domain-containing protein [Bacteroidota bacterium]